MALGGGIFQTQNKKLPGAYINFVSVGNADATLSDRGVVAMAFEQNWGANGIVTVSKADIIKDARKIFGYSYTDDEMQDIRDIFKNAVTLHAYRLNGAGVKAANTYATAKYAGTRGNDLKTVIEVNVDDENAFDVKTYLGTSLVDTQTVTSAAGLVPNDFVNFKTDATLAATAGVAFTGGTNSEVTGESHTEFLAAIEPYSFNAIATKSEENAIKSLYIAFSERMRYDVGKKFQLVVYNHPQADNETVISVPNSSAVIPWLLGAEGGCAVNASCTNKLYDGEADISGNVGYTQSQLEAFIDAGQLAFHRVGEDIRILRDINTLKTLTEDKGAVFQSNQTIRVIDQIANDIAVLFDTKYLGVIPNNASGRISLWNDIVKHHEQLQDLGAIENFSDGDVVVQEGNTKQAVYVTDLVTVVNSMEQLYMVVSIA